MKIRVLTKEDWKIWKSFRLEALNNSPENFGSSHKEEVNWSDRDFQNALTESDIFGVFIDSSLASCAGFYSLNSAKTKHRGVIWGDVHSARIQRSRYCKRFNSGHYKSCKITSCSAALNLCDQ